jgi:hypothetical protein
VKWPASPSDNAGELSPPLRIVLARTQEGADAAYPLGLLRPRRERPRRRRAAEERDDLAPSHHSITSSVRAIRRYVIAEHLGALNPVSLPAAE